MKIKLARSDEVRTAVAWHGSDRAYLLTLTIRHGLGDDLKRLAKTMDLTEGGRRPLGLVGRGVGVAIANPGELPISTSIVRMHYDGSVTVLCSM